MLHVRKRERAGSLSRATAYRTVRCAMAPSNTSTHRLPSQKSKGARASSQALASLVTLLKQIGSGEATGRCDLFGP